MRRFLSAWLLALPFAFGVATFSTGCGLDGELIEDLLGEDDDLGDLFDDDGDADEDLDGIFDDIFDDDDD